VRLLVLIAVIVLAWLLWRRFLAPKPQRLRRKRKPREVTRVVKCAHCGLHVPENEALQVEQDYYCSEEHRRLGRG
jgi:uncharacterized protein